MYDVSISAPRGSLNIDGDESDRRFSGAVGEYAGGRRAAKERKDTGEKRRERRRVLGSCLPFTRAPPRLFLSVFREDVGVGRHYVDFLVGSPFIIFPALPNYARGASWEKKARRPTRSV